MYGTVYRMRPKPGKEQELVRMMEEWNRERRPKVKGAVAGISLKLDTGGFMGAAIFQDKASYTANANDPEQDAWYQRLRALLESDPEWNDGEIATSWGNL